CIRALDIETGLPVPQWLQPQERNEELATFGRGLLAGEMVYWPTSHGLHVLKQQDGEPVAFDPRIRGNLAAAAGFLAAADAQRLAVYLPGERGGGSAKRERQGEREKGSGGNREKER